MGGAVRDGRLRRPGRQSLRHRPPPPPHLTLRPVVFDLEGTLLDSDAALAGSFVALGVPSESVTYGHVLADECARLGVSVDDYLDVYDPTAVRPYPGVLTLLERLDRWAVCSNKRARSGVVELERLGRRPELALFSEDFGLGPKRLGPVLEAMGLEGRDIAFVGDTDHDRRCATDVGCPFVLAGWNPRAEPAAGDLVAARPEDVVDLLAAL